MKELGILGRTIKLQQLNAKLLKGITIGDYLAYIFLEGEFRGVKMLFLRPKNGNPSPKVCALTADRISDNIGLPVIFILDSAPSFERQRLIDKDVFFVIGDKFVNLPMLVSNERIRKTSFAKRLSPVAQYILFYHLQVESLEGYSAMNMVSKLPYSYANITLGLTCLSDLGLCEKVADGRSSKVVYFPLKGKELWEKAQGYLIDPVSKRIYCDSLENDLHYAVCSINALAHYSRLNPDNIKMVMMGNKQFQTLVNNKALHGANVFDGDVMIEVWRYPVVSHIESKSEWVDKLSLAVSLREENDPRVEGEIESMINELEWKD